LLIIFKNEIIADTIDGLIVFQSNINKC